MKLFKSCLSLSNFCETNCLTLLHLYCFVNNYHLKKYLCDIIKRENIYKLFVLSLANKETKKHSNTPPVRQNKQGILEEKNMRI